MQLRDIVTARTSLIGFASWLIPFAISIPFFDHTGQLLIAQPLFKSIMVVVGGGTATALLVMAFRHVVPTARSGLALGCYWLLINLALDIAILVPMGKMTIAGYLADIGLRYLLIPIVSTGIGLVAERPDR